MQKYKQELNRLSRLATPVLIASIAQTGMGFVDTIMAGGVSATDMAAVSVAASIWLPAILFGVGLLMALVPVVAQLNGASRQVKIPFEIQQGIYLALLVSIPIIIVLLQTPSILSLMDVEPILAEKTNGYIYAVLAAVPAFLLFQTFRSFTDGLSLTKPAMIIGFIGLLLNIPLNWIFVYGKFGAPALGGVGCGIATTIVYWVMFAMLLGYVIKSKRLAHIALFKTYHPIKLSEQVRLFRLGFPVAASLFFEVTLFAAVAILVSPLGSVIVAAHQVAVNFSSLVFMLPMSIGVAVSIRVGHELGSGSVDGAKVATKVGIATGLGLSVITAILTVAYSKGITSLYTDDIAVTSIAIQLLLFAAIYQCTDAIQVVAGGALRGYKDMKAIFNRTFISYWVLGLPTGYILGSTDLLVPSMGAHGYWIGFIVGLSSAALLLAIRLYQIQTLSEEEQLSYSQMDH
ncbi:MATE family efflux transporter [Vibrio sp.]|nr:MATE family efflux transporter [Vibrio sp.]